MAATQFPMGNPMQGGGGTPPIDPEALNAVLKAYGVQMPSRLQPPGPLEAMGQNGSALPGVGGFMARHPGIATAGDNALIALGNMGPTSQSAGDNISNVARAVLGVQPYRRQQEAQQFEAPLAAAKEVGGLQTQQAMLQRDQSYIDYQKHRDSFYDAQAQRMENLNETNLQIAQARGQASILGHELSAKHVLITGQDGKPAVGYERFNPTTQQIEVAPLEGADPRQLLMEHHQQAFGGGNTGAMIGNNVAMAFGGYDKIPLGPDGMPDVNAPVPGSNKRLGQFVNDVNDRITYQTRVAPLLATAAGKDKLPPGEAEKWKAQQSGWNDEFKTLRYGNPKSKDLDTQISDYMTRNKVSDPDVAESAVRASQQQHDDRLGQMQDAWRALSPQDQMNYGGPRAYLKSQGYNATTHTFSQAPAAPQTSTTPSPVAPAVLGAGKTAAKSSSKPQASATGSQGTSRLTGPDGNLYDVPAAQVAAFKAAGGH